MAVCVCVCVCVCGSHYVSLIKSRESQKKTEREAKWREEQVSWLLTLLQRYNETMNNVLIRFGHPIWNVWAKSLITVALSDLPVDHLILS